MQAYFALVRRELGSYFVSISGYVIIAGTLLLLGFSFVDLLTKLNSEPTDVPLTEMFYGTYYFWLILLLTAPVMTMRLFALEKFSGTYETLMTTPVRDSQVVFAKFTGALLFFLFNWLPLLGCVLIVNHHSSDPEVLDAGALASTCLGIVLIGSLFMSMGCLASALTRSQVVASMISYALGIALFILSLRSLASESFSKGWAGELFSYISMVEHMQQFTQGTVDTRAVVYYLSLTTLFLFMTLKVVETRRWK